MDIPSVTGTENSFKCPKDPFVEIDDHVCTIEEMIVSTLPSPSPLSAQSPHSSSIVRITTRSCH